MTARERGPVEPVLGPADDVLVVDDVPDNRVLIRRLLAEDHIAVREATDGPSCLAAVQKKRPALVVLDVSMPRMDGFQVLKRLREGSAHDIPIVLLTAARRDAEAVEHGIALGADEYLVKPIAGDELRARVRALLRVSQAKRELERVRRDYTAMMVHDLRHPVSTLAMVGEVLSIAPVSDAQRHQLADQIRQTCADLLRHIDGVLTASRIESGVFTLDRTPQSLRAVVTAAVAPFAAMAAQRGIRFELGAIAAVLVEVDAPKLTQVIHNIVANALNFVPARGQIAVGATVGAQDRVRVTFDDSGPGIPPEARDSIFERYRQTSVGRAKGGAGLGLAIVKAIVEAHGGSVGVGDAPGGGARFWFELAVMQPPRS